ASSVSTQRSALADLSFLPHRGADARELFRHFLVQFDDLVQGVGNLAGYAFSTGIRAEKSPCFKAVKTFSSLVSRTSGRDRLSLHRFLLMMFCLLPTFRTVRGRPRGG